MIALFSLFGFGWGDSDRVAEQHLRDIGAIAEGQDVQGWFQVGPSLDGLEVVTIKTRTHTFGDDGVEVVGDWENPHQCFVRRGTPPAVWCDDAALPGLVASYALGRSPEQVADVTWVWAYVLATGEACGWPQDLIAANPHLTARQVELAGAPDVARTAEGGVVLTLPCVAGKALELVTVVVGADDSVSITRGAPEAPAPEPSSSGLEPIRGALRKPKE